MKRLKKKKSPWVDMREGHKSRYHGFNAVFNALVSFLIAGYSLKDSHVPVVLLQAAGLVPVEAENRTVVDIGTFACCQGQG